MCGWLAEKYGWPSTFYVPGIYVEIIIAYLLGQKGYIEPLLRCDMIFVNIYFVKISLPVYTHNTYCTKSIMLSTLLILASLYKAM